ncbi:BREX-1 system adenine-specific DNA-methyltransferase PglX [uncultured Senegalimassilia sp.]|uniref:BREX-1 system adenine-specific DNA-methyltransferase PglX n=1 Tax=uncultured Senegalimassilia sp. TaxID=1714350 RepID=UPI002675379C|nr:BREX-1 system adenine-specific DNA-methyltransferase PglX [uncultured Senegalimassilia sp.]
MNDTAIKNFCSFAREQLTCGVELRMARYGVTPEADAAEQPDAVGGVPLSPQERAQRADLLRQRDALGAGDAARSWARLRDRAAYTWFNRIVAIRFMELRDYLPSRARMFSDEAGALGSQALDQALDVEIGGMDPARVVELKQAGDDEALFRYLLLCQCRELAACLPGVFDPVGDAMELLLPDRLMAKGGVIEAMVEGIPEADWLGHVEILGWMYQYYNAEAKDAFFKSKDKATPETLPAATQLFTPEWIVRYMVQNSLGRLWMLNNPQSPLREQMEYYIEPDAAHEDFIAVDGPEDITLCDPACGSGHILVYAFELLFAMYLERGHRERDIPSLILRNNLRGLEIDPRAAQLASLALAMCAREHDRRFFGRGVRAQVRVLAPVVIAEDELPEAAALRKHPHLLETLAHLDEVGSLLDPTEDELSALAADAEALSRAAADGDLFTVKVSEKVARAKGACDALAERCHCVVANPPYMGSSSFGPFMSKWVKKNYPDSCRDLCTAFIERCINFGKAKGLLATVTSSTWMFISSFERLRKRLIEACTIDSLLHTQGPNNHPDVFDANAVMVLKSAHIADYEGGYFKLDKLGLDVKEKMLREAIQNPDCSWFYRRNADTFKQIPGTPIAYWASEVMIGQFNVSPQLSSISAPMVGGQTNDNEKFVRFWWEVPTGAIGFGVETYQEAASSNTAWFPFNKGGNYRKWYGNNELVVFWRDGGRDIKAAGGSTSNKDFYFKPSVTWSRTSSGTIACRMKPYGFVFDTEGASIVCDEPTGMMLQGVINSSCFLEYMKLLAPTLHFGLSDVSKVPVPIIEDGEIQKAVMNLVRKLRFDSKTDYDSFETSWDFMRHPLL